MALVDERSALVHSMMWSIVGSFSKNITRVWEWLSGNCWPYVCQRKVVELGASRMMTGRITMPAMNYRGPQRVHPRSKFCRSFASTVRSSASYALLYLRLTDLHLYNGSVPIRKSEWLFVRFHRHRQADRAGSAKNSKSAIVLAR